MSALGCSRRGKGMRCLFPPQRSARLTAVASASAAPFPLQGMARAIHNHSRDIRLPVHHYKGEGLASHCQAGSISAGRATTAAVCGLPLTLVPPVPLPLPLPAAQQTWLA